jgi:hypothetical protein
VVRLDFHPLVSLLASPRKSVLFWTRRQLLVAIMDSSLKIGTGLIEIAALTTLIGSSTAESMVLGDKAGPGVAWASMSALGSLSVIKGCIAGASPNWLRETLGVRSAISDAALGLKLDLRSRYRSNQDLARKNLGKALGGHG